MEVHCDLEVDVNGEESFMVDKRILASYSGKLSKLLGKSKASSRNLKVVFHDFPGGAESFELMSRFCYNNGSIYITPSNISFLYCASQFMEMNNSVDGRHNLLEKVEKSFQDIRYWSWSELLTALKQCQDLLPVANSLSLVEKCLDTLVARLPLTSEASPCPSTSSPDSSGIRFSCDTRSTESLKTSFSRAPWWFEDLLVLRPNLVEILVKAMVSQKLDHVIISKFLLYYQKLKFYTVKSNTKRTIAETVIEMLYMLDQRCVSCKCLFGILRVSLNLNLNKSIRNKLENMIGSQLDQATLDNLLVPSPKGINYLYDVNLVLRFLKSFLCDGGTCQASPMRLRKVAALVDLYIAEVAPDPCLKPSKFLALAIALPDSARDSYDELYHTIDMYLQVHAGLSEDEKMKICCVLNYEKLSAETCIHLSKKTKFPSKSAVQALVSQQSKLKKLLQTTNNFNSYATSPYSATTEAKNWGLRKDDANEQHVLYTGKLDLSTDNEKLRAHLQACNAGSWNWRKFARKCNLKWQSLQNRKHQATAIQDLCPNFVHDTSFAFHSISFKHYLIFVQLKEIVCFFFLFFMCF